MHLLHLEYDSPLWIQDPGGLLEWMVETGIIGVSLIAAGTLLYAMLIRRLLIRRLTSTMFLGSFSVALIAADDVS